MNNLNRAAAEVSEEGPHLKVVSTATGAHKEKQYIGAVGIASTMYARRARAELAILTWSNRAIRLAGKK